VVPATSATAARGVEGAARGKGQRGAKAKAKAEAARDLGGVRSRRRICARSLTHAGASSARSARAIRSGARGRRLASWRGLEAAGAARRGGWELGEGWRRLELPEGRGERGPRASV